MPRKLLQRGEMRKMKSLKDILDKKELNAQPNYVTKEFQAFGYRLAEELDDIKHKALYIKLAKEEPRSRLEKALEFVKSSKPRSKAKLFMWKLKKLRNDSQDKPK